MGIRYGGKILKFPYKVPSAKQNCRNINSSKLNAMLSLDQQCILIVRAHMLTSSTNLDMNTSPLYRGSYMSARVLLNLINELGIRDSMRGLPSILSLFRNEFNKFNKTRARMLDSFYHMALRLL